jgi:hypothetical protein
MSFTQSAFAQFISTGAGRGLRVIVGIALICYGYLHRPSTTGTVLMIVGLVPLVAGILNWCIISALLGGPLRGSDITKAAGKP